MGNPRRQTLLNLPHAIILGIAENLPLKDIPNLISSCKSMAAMADDFYRDRQAIDMWCFEPATPRLCEQLIARFSGARLQKLRFHYDVSRQHSYDQDTVEAILARFVDNVNPLNLHFQADLRGGSPRMLDILAHCYYLDRFLSSQRGLRVLDVDMEMSLFTIPSSRGPRLDWHLLNPFVTLDAVQRHCAALESYSAHKSSYQMSHGNLVHVQVRFLERCPKLKASPFVFVLGTEELDTYARLRRHQLALEQAVFFLPGWQVSPAQRRLNAVRLRNLGARLGSLKKAVVSFRRRGSLTECQDLFSLMPRIETLYLRCEFNPRYPVYDIDEGSDPFFGNTFAMLKGDTCYLSRLVLWGVPEDEFERLFSKKGGAASPLPRGLRELRVQLHWSSPNLGERRSRLLDEFLKSAPYLDTCCIAGVSPVPASQEIQPDPVFFKAKNWSPRHATPSCMFIFSGGKRRPSFLIP